MDKNGHILDHLLLRAVSLFHLSFSLFQSFLSHRKCSFITFAFLLPFDRLKAFMSPSFLFLKKMINTEKMKKLNDIKNDIYVVVMKKSNNTISYGISKCGCVFSKASAT